MNIIAERVKGHWQVALGVMCINAVLMAAGYTMLIPFLPLYLREELGVPPEQVSMWAGAVYSITFLIGGIMAPLWGKMADKHGKKLMALRSSIGLALSYYLMGVVTSPEQMFLVRLFQGFAAGLISIFLAMCSAIVPREKIGVGMGLFQASLVTGNVIGPLLGGLLATSFGMRVPFYMAAVSLVVLSLTTWFLLPEPPRGEVGSEPGKEAGNEAGNRALLQRPEMREVMGYMFLLWMTILIIQPIMALYVSELEGGADNVMLLSGAIFAVIGIAGAITAPLWGRLGQSKGFYLTLGLGMVCGSLASMANAIPDTVAGYALANVIFALFFGGVNPSLSAIVARITAMNERARAYAYMFSAQQFGSVLGPLIGGFYVSFMPMRTIYFISGGVLLLTGSYILYRHRKEITGGV